MENNNPRVAKVNLLLTGSKHFFREIEKMLEKR